MSRSSSSIDNDHSIDLNERWLEEYKNLKLQLMRSYPLDSIKAHEIVDKIEPLIKTFGEILMEVDLPVSAYQENVFNLKAELRKIRDALVEADPPNSIVPIQAFLSQCRYWMDAYSSRGHFIDLPNEVLLKIGSELPTKTLSYFQKTNWFYRGFFNTQMNRRKHIFFLNSTNVFCGPHQTFLLRDGVILAAGSNTAAQLNMSPRVERLSEFQLFKTPLTRSEGKVTHIVSGATHTLFQTEKGAVYVCGWNDFGQCGMAANRRGIAFSRIRFPFEENADSVTHMAAGAHHSLFVTRQGKAYGCGYDGNGQLSGVLNGLSYQTPQEIKFPLTASQDPIVWVAAGSAHSVFLTSRGDVYVCGVTISDGRIAYPLRRLLLPTELLNDPIVKVRAGTSCTVLLTKHGRVYACGQNEKGQLGTGNYQDCRVLTRVFDHPEDPAVDLQMGDGYSLVLTKSGQLYGCGDLRLGQVPSSNTFCKIPVALQGADNRIVKIAVGSHHFVLLTDSGNFYVAGNNHQGEIGLGSSSEQNSFVKLFSASEIQSLLAKSPEVIQESASPSLQSSRSI